MVRRIHLSVTFMEEEDPKQRVNVSILKACKYTFMYMYVFVVSFQFLYYNDIFFCILASSFKQDPSLPPGMAKCEFCGKVDDHELYLAPSRRLDMYLLLFIHVHIYM